MLETLDYTYYPYWQYTNLFLFQSLYLNSAYAAENVEMTVTSCVIDTVVAVFLVLNVKPVLIFVSDKKFN